ncbi:fungal-specific transcription factor domain-containing protein [Lipomyces oligophaga]|uniref:fungal-specific transcription factor domain-containing protein n=1 Tax=Lipomyces oligophaga TaxID=45792 RepID=UPI0034CF944E
MNNVSNQDSTEISTTDDKPTRKRKKAKSRKGLAKAFVCNNPGCDKSFTRLEHLGRHQLNHAPKRIYNCDWPGCSKFFVREDLRIRHVERHNRRRILAEESHYRNTRMLDSRDLGSRQMSIESLEATTRFPYYGPEGSNLERDIKSIATGLSSSSVDASSELTTVNLSNHISLETGNSTSSVLQSTTVPHPTEDHLPTSIRPDEYRALFTNPHDSVIEPSTDLIDWLFSDGMLRSDYVSSDFNSFLEAPIIDFSRLTSPPEFPHGEAVTDTVRQKLIDVIPQLVNDPMFTLDTIKMSLDLFWQKLHPQFPILHRRSFQVDNTPPALLLSMLAIGYAYGNMNSLGLKIAEPLRWIIFGSPDFQPPTHIWVLQSLLLLEVYEKLLSNRKLHARAHIHHGATLQLIRRGSTLRAPAVALSPDADGTSWKRWVEAESIKRAVIMAFILDVLHSVMFGHSLLMDAHEMRLSLPCDDAIWDSVDDGRQLLIDKPPVLSFLGGLKMILNQQSVEVDGLGRLALICGLMSLSVKMVEQVRQMSSIGWGGAFRDSWVPTIGAAYDFWIDDYKLQKRRDDKKAAAVAALSAEDESPSYSMIPMFLFLHHVAKVSIHVSRYDLHAFCGDSRLLGRSTLKQDFHTAKSRIYDWAHTRGASVAAFHSLRALYQTFICGDEMLVQSFMSSGSTTPKSGTHATGYLMSDDVFVHRPHMIVDCALVYWAYAYCRNGPESTMLANRGVASQKADGGNAVSDYWKQHEWAIAAESGRVFLERMSALRTPEELEAVVNGNRVVGLLKWVISALHGSRWELMDELISVLENCVQRSLGQGEAFLDQIDNPQNKNEIIV